MELGLKNIYKANWKYYINLIFYLFINVIFANTIYWSIKREIQFLLIFSLAIFAISNYFYLFIYPRKIIITEKNILYYTLLIKRKISYQQIDEIYTHIPLWSRIIAGDSEDLALTIYYIKIDDSPYLPILFLPCIKNYKDLKYNVFKKIK